MLRFFLSGNIRAKCSLYSFLAVANPNLSELVVAAFNAEDQCNGFGGNPLFPA